MRRLFLALSVLPALAAPAVADDFSRVPGQSSHRAFWLDSQPWPSGQEQTQRRKVQPFPLNYTDSVAQRLGVGGSRNLFEHRFEGLGGPALVGSVDGGPKLLLRWHTGE